MRVKYVQEKEVSEGRKRGGAGVTRGRTNESVTHKHIATFGHMHVHTPHITH